MADPMDKLRFMQQSQQHANRQAKREVWQEIQEHMPELAALIARLPVSLRPTQIKTQTTNGVKAWRK